MIGSDLRPTFLDLELNAQITAPRKASTGFSFRGYHLIEGQELSLGVYRTPYTNCRIISALIYL